MDQRFNGRKNMHELLYRLLTSPYQQYPIIATTRRNRSRDKQQQEIIGYEVRLSQWNTSRKYRSGLRCVYQDKPYRRKKQQNLDFSPSRRLPQSTMRLNRQKSAPGCIRNTSSEPYARVSSAYDKTMRRSREEVNAKLAESSSEMRYPSETMNEVLQACEITMMYGIKAATATKSAELDEVVVIQQRSTSENRIVYRGFLGQGDTFSFKSHHRSVSPVCLAFYVKGIIDGVVYNCCEFNYKQEQQKSGHNHGRFRVESVGKTGSCEKCRNRMNHEGNTDGNDSKVEDRKPKEQPHSRGKPSKEETAKPVTDDSPKTPKSASDVKSKTIETSPSTRPKTIATVEKKTSDGESNDNRQTMSISFQDFMSLLQELQSTHKTDFAKTIRHPKSVENFVYIIDAHIAMSNEDHENLSHLIHFGLTWNTVKSDDCLNFINQMSYEQIMLMISKENIDKLDENIKKHPKVSFIYVIDPSLTVDDPSTKIRGTYLKMSDLNRQLSKDLIMINADLVNILSISAGNHGASSFAFVQVLKEILLETEESMNLKEDLLEFSREIYTNNPSQMKYIDEFQSQYQADQALRWYQRSDTFISKMLTRACRVPDPDILFKLRLMIQDLHTCIKSHPQSTSLTLYRTIRVSKKTFDEIQRHQDGFLSFNQFLVASKTQEKPPMPFMKADDDRWMVFQMELGANVSRIEIDGNPNQFILPWCLPFKIVNIETNDDDDGGGHVVRLISNDDTLRVVQGLTKEIRDASRGAFPLLRLAKLMRRMEYMQHTEYFSLMIINHPIAIKNDSANLTLGGLFHALGTYYYEQRAYEHALKHLQNSLEVYLRVLPSDDVKLSPTYNNMGSIYHKQGFDEKALKYHKIAYDIQMKSGNPDIDSVAAYAANIASVLAKLGRYGDALPYLERDLKIRQRLHPNEDDPELAVKYHNLAGAQFRVHKYREALENYQKCLNIELKCHPSTHPTVAVTYYNMATAYEALGQLEEAMGVIKKGIERLLKTKAEDDEEVQMQRQYEQRLQQKLWVKSLFVSEHTE